MKLDDFFIQVGIFLVRDGSHLDSGTTLGWGPFPLRGNTQNSIEWLDIKLQQSYKSWVFLLKLWTVGEPRTDFVLIKIQQVTSPGVNPSSMFLSVGTYWSIFLLREMNCSHVWSPSCQMRHAFLDETCTRMKSSMSSLYMR